MEERGSLHRHFHIRKHILFAAIATEVLAFAFLAWWNWPLVQQWSIDRAYAASTIPKVINYQARITDASGVPVPDGSLSVKAAIYDAPTGGTCLYEMRGSCGTPTAKTVTVSSGAFSTLIGDTGDNAIPDNLFDTNTLYLGITVGSDAEMTPRKRIGSSGYAFNADRLDNLDTSSTGGAGAYVPVTDSAGNLTITGLSTVASQSASPSTNLFQIQNANDSVRYLTVSSTATTLAKDLIFNPGAIRNVYVSTPTSVGTTGSQLVITGGAGSAGSGVTAGGAGAQWTGLLGGNGGAGTASAAGGEGGLVYMEGGSAGTDNGGGGADGGNANIFGGPDSGSGHTGGNVNISGGYSANGVGGYVRIYAGTGGGDGYIQIGTITTSSVNIGAAATPTYVNGNMTVGAAASGARLTVRDANVSPTNNIFQISNANDSARYFTVSSTSTRVYGDLTVDGTCTGCGGGSSTLQGAYTGSTSPELTLDATRGALTIRDAASTVGNLLEIQNNANSASYFTVSSTGVGIGNASPVRPLDIIGPNATDGAQKSEVIISDSTAYNASPVAGILFGTKYTSAGAFAGMGGIAVGKENATDGNLASYLGLYTRPAAGSVTERVRVDSAGNVGIGTSAPTTPLTVGPNPAAAFNANELVQLAKTGDAYMTIRDGSANFIFGTTSGVPFAGSQTNSDFTLRTNNAEKVRLTAAGNFGIGDTTPAALFTVGNGDRFQVDSNGNITWPNAATVTLANATNALNIDSNTLVVDALNNRVGIGTSSPSAALEVGSGAAQTNLIINGTGATSYNGLVLETSGTEKWFLGRDGTDSTDDLIFRAGGTTNVLRAINAGAVANTLTLNAGNVGVGDTSPASLFTVGNGDLFQVNSSGNIVKINNVTYSWPASQAASSGYALTNDGAGNLSWAATGGGSATLQAAYTNSTNPEITLDSTRGAITVRDASTTVGNLLELENNGNTITPYFTVSSTSTNLAYNSITNGTVMSLTADGLTGGTGLSLSSAGTLTGSTGFLAVTANGAATGTIVKLNGSGLTSGTLLSLNGGGAMTTGNIISASGSAATGGTGATTGLYDLTANVTSGIFNTANGIHYQYNDRATGYTTTSHAFDLHVFENGYNSLHANSSTTYGYAGTVDQNNATPDDSNVDAMFYASNSDTATGGLITLTNGFLVGDAAGTNGIVNGFNVSPSNGSVTNGYAITGGTVTNGINFTGATGITTDFVMQNGESLDNDVNGTINAIANTFQVSAQSATTNALYINDGIATTGYGLKIDGPGNASSGGIMSATGTAGTGGTGATTGLIDWTANVTSGIFNTANGVHYQYNDRATGYTTASRAFDLHIFENGYNSLHANTSTTYGFAGTVDPNNATPDDTTVDAMFYAANTDTATGGQITLTNAFLVGTATVSNGIANGFAVDPTSGSVTNGFAVTGGTVTSAFTISGGTVTNGLYFNGATGLTNDIVLQNGETIDNDVNGTINLTADTTKISNVSATTDALSIAGTNLTSGDAIFIDGGQMTGGALINATGTVATGAASANGYGLVKIQANIKDTDSFTNQKASGLLINMNDISNSSSGQSIGADLEITENAYVGVVGGKYGYMANLLRNDASPTNNSFTALYYAANNDTSIGNQIVVDAGFKADVPSAGSVAMTNGFLATTNVNTGMTNGFTVKPTGTITNGFVIGTGGTVTNGINFGGAGNVITTDFVMQNSETIDNNTDGTINLSANTTQISPQSATLNALTIAGTNLTSGNGIFVNGGLMNGGELISATGTMIGSTSAGVIQGLVTINNNTTYPGQFTNNNFSGGMLVNMNDISTGTCGSYGCGGSAFGYDLEVTMNSFSKHDKYGYRARVLQNNGSPTDNVFDSLFIADNSDTAQGNQLTVTNGFRASVSGAVTGMTNGFMANPESGTITNGFAIGTTGTVTNGINFSGAASVVTNDFVMQNGETIDNNTDGTINFTDGTNSLASVIDNGTTGRFSISAPLYASAASIQGTVTNNSFTTAYARSSGGFVPGMIWYATDDNSTKPKAGFWMDDTVSGSNIMFGTSNTYTSGINNTAMTIDPSGNVGIGDTTPLAMLTVGSGDLFRVTSTGSVGIGGIAPGTKLDVDNAVQALASSLQGTVSNNSIAISYARGGPGGGGYTPGLVWYATDDNATKPKAGIWARDTNTGAYLQFGTSKTYTSGITNTALTIDPDGDVGVGTTSPGASLVVADHLASPTTNIFQITNANDSTRYLTVNSTSTYMAGNVGIGDSTPAALLTVGSGDRFQVDSSGNLTWPNAATVTLASAANALNFDANTMDIDAANHRVGIGTATPAALLSVGTGSPFQVNSSGNISTSGTITSTASSGNTLVIDSTTLVVDATNNRVGIHTSTPLFPLDFGSTTGNDIISLYNDGTTGYSYGIGVQSGSFDFNLAHNLASFYFYDDSSHTNELMQLDGNGTLRISTLTTSLNGLCHASSGTSGTGVVDEVTDCSGTPGDVAEWYPSADDSATSSDILVITDASFQYGEQLFNPRTGLPTGATGTYEVSVLDRSSTPYDTRIIGIVSTSPNQIFGEAIRDNAPHAVPMAIAGRVPTRVTDESGPIRAGDPITTSSTAGAGMKATKPGMIVGYALGSWNGPGEGVIQVLVHPEWSGNGSATDTAATGFSITPDSQLDFQRSTITDLAAIVSSSGNWSVTEDGYLVVKHIEADTVQAKEFQVVQTDQTQTIGNATVPVGYDAIVVHNPAATAQSKIFVTFDGRTRGGFWVAEKGSGDFTVHLEIPADSDLPFEYWIVNVDDRRSPAPSSPTDSGSSTPLTDPAPTDSGSSTSPVDSGSTTSPVDSGTSTSP